MDVNEEYIDSGDFPLHVVGLDHFNWEHKPTDRRNVGRTRGYADGHSEHQRWKWPRKWKQWNDPPANRLFTVRGEPGKSVRIKRRRRLVNWEEVAAA